MNPARKAVVRTLQQQAKSRRSMPPLPVDPTGLDPRDRRLAVAIHRTTVQRWLTLEALLDAHLKKPLVKLEPILLAVLLSGAAQIVFMDKLPAHAVVHEQVEIAKNRLRRGAASLANAVLRKLAAVVVDRTEIGGWTPARDAIPYGDGAIRLAEPLLPSLDDLPSHLAVATSHPLELVNAWLGRFGAETVRDLLLHDAVNPPTVVYAPSVNPADVAEHAQPHASDGFFVWTGEHAALESILSGGSDRWVQDPASAAPVGAVAEFLADRQPNLIVDACAGRGTKTRQLAHLFPSSRIVATDIDEARLEMLRQSFAGHDRVRILSPDELSEHEGRADLLLLDVPCSNTGVLARRPEARYRYTDTSLGSLSAVQREIAEQTAPLLADQGVVLYATCSIEPTENDDQAAWIAGRLGRAVQTRRTILPVGSGSTYHDGSYHAIIG